MCRPLLPSGNLIAEQWGDSKVSSLLSQPHLQLIPVLQQLISVCMVLSAVQSLGSQRAPSKRMNTKGYVKLTAQ